VITPVCELLGIEQPIVQAPMAAVPQLAAEMPVHPDYRRALIAAAETDPQWYPKLYDVG
jgi:hypothetical protein